MDSPEKRFLKILSRPITDFRATVVLTVYNPPDGQDGKLTLPRSALIAGLLSSRSHAAKSASPFLRSLILLSL